MLILALTGVKKDGNIFNELRSDQCIGSLTSHFRLKWFDPGVAHQGFIRSTTCSRYLSTTGNFCQSYQKLAKDGLVESCTRCLALLCLKRKVISSKLTIWLWRWTKNGRPQCRSAQPELSLLRITIIIIMSVSLTDCTTIIITDEIRRSWTLLRKDQPELSLLYIIIILYSLSALPWVRYWISWMA